MRDRKCKYGLFLFYSHTENQFWQNVINDARRLLIYCYY